MKLIKYIEFKAGISFLFKDALHGIQIKPKIFSTNSTNTTMYDNWTFSNMYLWDDFFYADNTNLLLNSDVM